MTDGLGDPVLRVHTHVDASECRREAFGDKNILEVLLLISLKAISWALDCCNQIFFPPILGLVRGLCSHFLQPWFLSVEAEIILGFQISGSLALCSLKSFSTYEATTQLDWDQLSDPG